MSAVSEWVPMQWPESWTDSSLLNLLRGTPFNCLVLRWGEHKPAPAFLEQARQRGLALVGLVGGTGRAGDLRSAEAARLDAVALGEKAESSLPVIAWGQKLKPTWAARVAGFAIAGEVWPAIPSRDEAEGGPTGVPWVDSNGWLIQLARATATGEPAWLSVAPPAEARMLAENYVLAVADAGAYGARWVVELDGKLAAALSAHQANAVETWKAIVRAARFFEAHREWSAFPPYSNVAVLSDFAGPNEYVGQELLNLLPRRGVTSRILLKSQAAQAPLTGLTGILYPDQDPPSPALREHLLAFVQEGGVLLAHTGWPAPEGVRSAPDPFGRWNVYPAGKGRLAISSEEGLDPYLMASDAQLLVGHRHDLVRYYNFSSLNGYYTALDSRAVLHVINYALRPFAHPVSVVLARGYRGARLWRPDAEVPAPLELEKVPNGVELHLPPLRAYAAIELES